MRWSRCDPSLWPSQIFGATVVLPPFRSVCTWPPSNHSYSSTEPTVSCSVGGGSLLWGWFNLCGVSESRKSTFNLCGLFVVCCSVHSHCGEHTQVFIEMNDSSLSALHLLFSRPLAHGVAFWMAWALWTHSSALDKTWKATVSLLGQYAWKPSVCSP